MLTIIYYSIYAPNMAQAHRWRKHIGGDAVRGVSSTTKIAALQQSMIHPLMQKLFQMENPASYLLTLALCCLLALACYLLTLAWLD